MKKIPLPVILLFLVCTTYGQVGRWQVGVQGGINLNRIYGNAFSGANISSTTGGSFGINGTYTFSDRWGIRAQVSYDQLGWAFRSLYLEDSANGLIKADVVYKLNYLNLPVMAEYSFGKKIRITLEAGGFAGLLLNNRVVEKAAFATASRPAVRSYSSSDRNKINAGLAAGAGIQIPLGKKLLLNVIARNYTGLTSIGKPISGYRSSIKTMTFSFLSGLSFRL